MLPAPHLALAVLGHLRAKIVRIEHLAVKQEPGRDILAALAAPVAPDADRGPPSATGTSLERDRWVELSVARQAPASALPRHDQNAGAVRATVPQQRHGVEEPPGTLGEPGHRGHQVVRQRDHVDAVAVPVSQQGRPGASVVQPAPGQQPAGGSG